MRGGFLHVQRLGEVTAIFFDIHGRYLHSPTSLVVKLNRYDLAVRHTLAEQYTALSVVLTSDLHLTWSNAVRLCHDLRQSVYRPPLQRKISFPQLCLRRAVLPKDVPYVVVCHDNVSLRDRIAENISHRFSLCVRQHSEVELFQLLALTVLPSAAPLIEERGNAGIKPCNKVSERLAFAPDRIRLPCVII